MTFGHGGEEAKDEELDPVNLKHHFFFSARPQQHKTTALEHIVHSF